MFSPRSRRHDHARRSRTLVELEAIIERDWDAFNRVGAALAEIRDRKLYRGSSQLTDTEHEALQTLVPLRLTAIEKGEVAMRNGTPLPSCLVCGGRRGRRVRRWINRAGGRNIPGYEGRMPMPGYYERRPTLWVGLCDGCADDAELERRHLLRRERREDIAWRSCGERFTPPRVDAAYCSPACRQKAYRRRQWVAA